MVTSVKVNFAFNAAYHLLLVLVPLITTPYLSRTIGATGVGTYAYAYTIANYFTLFAMLGMSTYGVRTIASARDKGQEHLSRTFSSVYASQLSTCSIVLIAYLCYAFFMPATDFAYAIIWVGWIVSCFLDVSWLLFGVEEFKVPTVVSSLVRLAELACILLFVKSIDDLGLYMLIMSVGTIATQVFIWPAVRRHVRFVRPTWAEVKVHYAPNLILFIPVITISLYTMLDKVMLGAMTNMVQTGYFDYSEKISKIPLAIITALGTVMLPRMSNMFATDQRKEGLKLLDKSMWFMMMGAFAMMFGVIAISPEFVPVFFGPEFAPCVMLMIMLSVIIPLIAATNVLGRQYMLPCMQDKLFTLSVLAGAIVNIIVNIILIPRYMALGAAIGTLSAEFTVLIVQCIIVRKQLPLGRYLKNALPYVAIGAIMALVVRVAALGLNAWIGVGTLGLILEILVGIIVFTALTLVWCLATKDVYFHDIFGGFLKRITKRAE